MKRRIRISESMVRNMVAKTVKSVISENKRRNAIRRRRLNEDYELQDKRALAVCRDYDDTDGYINFYWNEIRENLTNNEIIDYLFDGNVDIIDFCDSVLDYYHIDHDEYDNAYSSYNDEIEYDNVL